MAQLNDITINVGINISDDTAQRCLQLLRLYLIDNPDREIQVEESLNTWDGQRNVSIYFKPKEADKGDK